MAQTPRTWDDYVGNGVKNTFQVTFPYQKQQEVFVTVDGAPAAFTFISVGWIQLAAAPANGAAIRVQRSTEAFKPRHAFENGVPLLPRFIDENNRQFLYAVQEAVNETAGVAADALSAAGGAVRVAQTASDKIDVAVRVAQTASDKADAAVGTAQTASNKADAAVGTAQAASGKADVAVGTAQTASDKIDVAVRVAQTASDKADAAVGTAQTASNKADAAVGIAQTASGKADAAVGIAQTASNKIDAAVIESAHQLRLDLSNAIAPEKGAKLIGYKGSTVAQKLDDLGTAAIRNAQVSPTDVTAGALMAVGAFGLGGVNVSIIGTDLNTLSKTGFYMGDRLINAPLASAVWFYVLHQEHGSTGYSSQIAIDLVSPTPKTYQRQKSGGIWFSWRELLHTGNLLQTTGTSTDFPMSQAAVTNAINSSSIGVGQTWQNVTASRAFATTYTNTTGRPITVNVGTDRRPNITATMTATVGGVPFDVDFTSSGAQNRLIGVFIVPSGATYQVSTDQAFSLQQWMELR